MRILKISQIFFPSKFFYMLKKYYTVFRRREILFLDYYKSLYRYIKKKMTPFYLYYYHKKML